MSPPLSARGRSASSHCFKVTLDAPALNNIYLVSYVFDTILDMFFFLSLGGMFPLQSDWSMHVL